jgi:hypothetical protein
MQARTMVRWTLTALMAALMTLSALPDVFRVPAALAVFNHLGYPPYLLPFLGTAKLLGVAAVLVPGVPKIKEWAFAGLTFDVLGALYSHLSVGDGPAAWMPALVGLMLVCASYGAYRLRMTAERTSSNRCDVITSNSGHLDRSSQVVEQS